MVTHRWLWFGYALARDFMVVLATATLGRPSYRFCSDWRTTCQSYAPEHLYNDTYDPEESPMIAPDVTLGEGVIVFHPELVNLYGCTIGDNCKIATFVEIQRGVVLGRNVKVEAFAFIPSGVRIEDGAFIGPHVAFTNDRYPAAVDAEGNLLGGTGSGEWELVETVVERGASIGANATIVPGVRIGAGALVGAGSVVTRSVPAGMLVVGNPARVVGPRPR
jgi:UDP-2-acetamido-3-amino-2,3-dideoxy-glucuronate N-acetyltransferase